MSTQGRFLVKNGIDNNSNTIINVASPVNLTDAANKNYVDSKTYTNVIYGAVPTMTGTTVIPYDNTAPLITEGTQLFSGIITPSFTTSKVSIEYNVALSASSNSRVITLAIFRNTTLVSVAGVEVTSSNRPENLNVLYIDSPARSSAITYSIRVGINSGIWYTNSMFSGNSYGGFLKSSYRMTEILA